MAEITAKDLLLQSAAIQSNPRLQAAAGNDEVTPMDTLTTPIEQPSKSISDMANINPLGVGGEVFDERWYKEQDSIRTEAEDNAYIPGDGFISNTARQFMHGGNIAVNVGKELYRKTQAGPTDYAWNEEAVNTWLDQRKDKIAPEQRWRWFGTINNTEAEMLLADYTSDNRAAQINSYRGGFENFAAGALAGLVDVDAPITFLSGGLSAGAKLGINASRISRLLRGTVAGGITGLGMGQLDYMVNPNSDAESVALMGLMGAGFGLVGGGLAHGKIQKDAIDDLGNQVIDGVQTPRTSVDTPAFDFKKAAPVVDTDAPTRAPEAFDPDKVESDVLTGGTSSVGAQNLNPTYDGLGINSVSSPDSKQDILDAVQWRTQSQAMRDWDDPTAWMNAGLSEAAVRKAIRFREYVQKLGIGTDFDKAMRSGLATLQKFAVHNLESPSGIAREQVTGATMRDAYFKEMSHTFRPYQDAFREYWATERGGKWLKVLAEPWGTGSRKAKQDFNEEVVKELMSRRLGGAGTTSNAAKLAADAVDATFKKEHEIGKGMPGENPIQDYDTFQSSPGYLPQRWSGRKLADMLDDAGRRGGVTARNAMKKRLYEAVEHEYAIQAPQWDPRVRAAAAQAVVDRALASRRGFQHDLIALLRGDEADFIRAAMIRNNVPANEIDSVVLSITQSREQKTKLGQTQHRQEVDFRAVSPNGVRLMDMLETDIEILVGRRATSTAGLAALARNGFSNKIDFERWKKSVLDEQEARGKRVKRPGNAMDKVDDFVDDEPEITPEWLDGLYSYFTGIRPNAGQGLDAQVQRLKKVTQLSTMNQLGLTSVGEYGAVAGAVGWKRFVKHAGADFMSMLTKVDSPIVQELKHFAVFEREEGLFNARLLHDLDMNQDKGLLSQLDGVLNKGVELQGVISGFYAIRASQQRIAISAFTARLFEGFHGAADGFNAQRLKDVGIDNAFMNRVMRFAQFEPDGSLRKLNMDQWTPEDVQHYQRIASRVTNQLVQKAMAGESNWAFHSSGLAQLFFQLKSFPLLAINKQFVRNTRMADKQALMTFFHGLVLSGAAYAAKEVVNGRSEDLTAERIARGALNYSNMTGWIPMFVDPVLGMAGADGSLSGYSSHGTGSVLALPAALTVGDRLLQLPGAAAKLLLSPTGLTDFKNSDIRILQSIPLLGNAYGINGILNNMKD